jgi:hypothetical protein
LNSFSFTVKFKDLVAAVIELYIMRPCGRVEVQIHELTSAYVEMNSPLRSLAALSDGKSWYSMCRMLVDTQSQFSIVKKERKFHIYAEN